MSEPIESTEQAERSEPREQAAPAESAPEPAATQEEAAPLDEALAEIAELLRPVIGHGSAEERAEIHGRLREARRADDPNLPQGVWVKDLKTADWASVLQVGARALQTHSKDLQVGIWMLDAWLHQEGLPGMIRGLKLLTGLIEGHWGSLYPPLDDGGADQRLAYLDWMDRKLGAGLRQTPIASPRASDAQAYTLRDWRAALRLENLGRRNAKLARAEAAKGAPTRERILFSAGLTPREDYDRLIAGVDEAERWLSRLEASFDAGAGAESLHMVGFREILSEIRGLAVDVLRGRGELERAAPEDAPEAGGDAPDEARPERPVARGPIRSRQEAYQQLAEAAEYLMRTEPHSPVPYLVKRAVAWGGLGLTDLLPEFVRNKGELSAIFDLLGVQNANEQNPTQKR